MSSYLPKKDIQTIYANYKNYYNSLKGFNTRKPNFPEIVSEHLIVYHLMKTKNYDKYIWKCREKSDLCVFKGETKTFIEIKCSTSDAPISFGPKQNWDYLYIIDLQDFLYDEVRIHCVKGNESLKTVKVNRLETFEEQCKQKRRPRISLEKLIDALGKSANLIYDGSILDLLE